ncbi:ADP-ribose glycohydrolase OARD1 isoform X2 [Erpetoichthys calabaricus]|uniref:O-acyl-ADP-ribose deacylase 1 n=1 Tax=Erpetoichthys calabaricus TaxID=27687 RepID=A0A8C4SW11_ERPCA|nr:ADP-ribose glycohydrolase OARD1 isoform X2 [Erpetoichthys calabaricus]
MMEMEKSLARKATKTQRERPAFHMRDSTKPQPWKLEGNPTETKKPHADISCMAYSTRDSTKPQPWKLEGNPTETKKPHADISRMAYRKHPEPLKAPIPYAKGRDFHLKHVKGDLFSCPPTDALAHCISEDCRMGAGIAVIFKKKFGGVQELLMQKKTTGDCAVLKRDGRFVYYLITKMKVFHKPTYSSLKSSLEAMKMHIVRNEVKSLSMPRIGCGLDRLNWEQVSRMIEDLFKDTDIQITIYSL